VQRFFDRLAERFVDAIRHQTIEAGAFIHFIEMR